MPQAGFLVRAPQKLLRLALGSILAVLLGEVLIRWIEPAYNRDKTASPQRIWKNPPLLDMTWTPPCSSGVPIRIRTDAHGLRLGHPIGRKKPGVFRIAVLGDSFTFGALIRERHVYVDVVGRLLSKQSARPIEVANLGVSAYAVPQERATLEEEGPGLKPDLVLVALYLGNDLQETLGLHKRAFSSAGRLVEIKDHHIVNGRMVPIPPSERPHGLKVWLRDHSRFYSILADQMKAIQVVRGVGTRVGVIARERTTLSPELKEQMLWSGWGMVSLLRETPPALEDAWRLVFANLEAMKVLSGNLGARFAVVLIPYPVQLVAGLRQEQQRSLGVSDADLDLTKPNLRVAAWGRAKGVPVLDLLEAFRKAPKPADLYCPEDVHWNDRGHAWAGRALAAQLIAERLVPSGPLTSPPSASRG
jgi:lysophospholipase L1-like esterase